MNIVTGKHFLMHPTHGGRDSVATPLLSPTDQHDQLLPAPMQRAASAETVDERGGGSQSPFDGRLLLSTGTSLVHIDAVGTLPPQLIAVMEERQTNV